MDNYYQFHDLEDMKKLPGLSIPDYRELNRRFLEAVHEPANKIYRTNPENGHPIFGAYTLSDSNEMVTWGILAVGEWLMNLLRNGSRPPILIFSANPIRCS